MFYRPQHNKQYCGDFEENVVAVVRFVSIVKFHMTKEG